MLLAVTGMKAQTPTTAPVHFFYMVPQHNLHDSAFIADSLYANGNHDSMISIDYKIYYNGVLIDTMSKYGWAMLKLRQAGTEYVTETFHTGTFDFPRDIPFMGMVAHSFNIGVINAESGKQLFGNATPKCNRNRPPMLYLHFNVPGTYKVVVETYSQKGATVSYIGTQACGKYKDSYSLTGDKRALWTTDTVSFVVHSSLIHIDSATICQGDVYRWRGKDYITSGTYKETYINQDGSDSVYQLVLNVIATVNSEKSANICQGNSYYWRGKYLTQAGVYMDSVQNKNGCKDRYKLTLSVRPRFLQVDTMWRCANTSFQWRGRTISSAGLHTWSYTPVYHCDSVYQLRVFNYPVYTFRDTVVICAGSSFSWLGGSYSKTGTYSKKYKTVNGCDSIRYLHLTVDAGFYHADTLRICSANGYFWRGRTLLASGRYTDSLKNRHGCDSVYALQLELNQVYSSIVYDTVCAAQNYVWAGHSVPIGRPSAGNHTYWDSLKTKAGCDSVFKLLLTVRPYYFYESSASVCANDIYSWKGHAVSIGRRPAGSYVFWDSLKNRYGCDSVYKLNLRVFPNYYTEQKVSICDNEWYVWPGHSVGIGKKPAGSYQYWDSLKTKNGCDSVFKLILTVYPTYSFSEKAEICDHETYNWKGHAVSIGQRAAGSYVIWDSLKTMAGCDSIYRLQLTVHPNHFFADTVDICDNGLFVWKGHAVSIGRKAAGSYQYWDSLKTIHGCDSIYRLQLNVHPTFLHTDTFEICDGGGHLWRGRRLTAAGWYSDSLKTKYGCDSVYRLLLEVHPTYLFEEIVPICNNGMYRWRGRQLTQAGVYTDSLLSRYSCDSVYRLDLRVNPVYLYEDTLDGCEGHSYQWRGRQLVKAGIYTDSLKASFGCDSVFRMVLRLHPNHLRQDTAEICEHAACRWHGKNYTRPGWYADTLHSIWGCDSVCRLLLRVHPVYVTDDTVALCDNELPYMWRGRHLTKAGVYADSLQSIHGCDSVYTMLLQVYPTYIFKDTISICSHEICSWHGRQLKKAGDYDERLRSIHGCDSVYLLHLIVRKSYFYYDTAEICNNGYYTWRGRLLSRPGGYVDSLQTMEGCPEVYRLWLRVHPTFLQEDTMEICAGDRYLWHGMTLDSSGTYSDSLRSLHGCDSVYRLHLIVRPSYLFAEKLEICWPQTCMWRGRLLDTSGVYENRFVTLHGCDSIYRLQLTVNPSYLMEEKQQICNSSYYEWRGRKLFKSGFYTDSLKTRNGCDSVFRLQLQVNPVYLFADTVVVCGNGNYLWHGRRIRQSGVYTDSLKTIVGCDSVFVLSLTMLPTYHFADTVDLCGEGTYVWRGMLLSQPGYYTDSLRATDGCDSVYSLTLRMHSVQMTNDLAAICEDECYWWNGRMLTVHGRYIDTLKSRYGCDSIVRFFLYTYPVFLQADTVNYCDAGVYLWRGRTITEDGCYTDSFKTVYGCDSVYRLVIRFRSLFFKEERATICSNDPFMWHGRNFAASGLYYDSLSSRFGCDSVYALRLTVHPAYLMEDSVGICQGEAHVWRGKPYTTSGVYTDSLLTIHGCDSIYRLVLQVHPVFFHSDTVEIGKGAVHTWRGKPYTTTGVYTDSLKTMHGCDSIYRLVLTVYPVYLFTDTMEICHGGTCMWRGRQHTDAGVYFDSLQTVNGYDSIFRLVLRVYPVYQFADKVEICKGAVYQWRGKQYMASGVYYDSLKTMHGCDSVYRLALTVYPVYHVTEKVDICQGERHIWRGRSYMVSGLYSDSLKTIHGCDSVFQLQLNVHPVYRFADTVGICQGAVYNWRGKVCHIAGVYTDSLKTIHGCDSLFRLVLQVHPVCQFTDSVEICQGAQHKWRGKAYAATGTYYDSLKTIHGCDSVFRLVLRVYPTYLKEEKQELCSGERYQWRGRMLQAGGTYTDSLKTIHGCDSLFRLQLTVYPVYRIIDTVEICQGERHNWRGRSYMSTGLYTDSLKTVHGCDSLFGLQLYVRPTYLQADTMQTCDNRPVIWHGRQLAVTGTYYDSLKTVHGCDSVFRLALSVLPTYLSADTVALCENELPYTWHGRQLQAEGDYSDSLQTADGCDSVCRFRLIVHPVYAHAFADTICEGTPYNRYGFVLSADSTTGVPQLLLTDSLRSAEGCDSVVTLALQIRILPKEMLPIHGDTLVSHDGTFMYYTDTVAGIESYAWEVVPQSIGKTVSANKVWLEFDKSAFGWDTLILVGHHQCGQTSPQYLPIHVTIGLAVEQVAQQEGVRLFPNPAQESVTLELRSYESWENPRWMLCDMQGRLLESGAVESMRTQIRLDAFPRGVYMVRVVSAGSRQCSMKVVKY